MNQHRVNHNHNNYCTTLHLFTTPLSKLLQLTTQHQQERVTNTIVVGGNQKPPTIVIHHLLPLVYPIYNSHPIMKACNLALVSAGRRVQRPTAFWQWSWTSSLSPYHHLGSAVRQQPQQTPSSHLALTSRSFSTKYAPNPLDAFRDPVDRQTRSTEPVGRSWSVKELRRKSYQDLHKLWYVLYKERNMLLTEQQLSRRRQLVFPQPERLYKVQKSMGAIKQVLGERKREKVAAHLASQMESSMMDESEDQDEFVQEDTK
jgi:large subunit ribosomal protein L47